MRTRATIRSGGPTTKMINKAHAMHMAHAQLQHPPRLESVSGEAETVHRLWYNELTSTVFMGSPATAPASGSAARPVYDSGPTSGSCSRPKRAPGARHPLRIGCPEGADLQRSAAVAMALLTPLCQRRRRRRGCCGGRQCGERERERCRSRTPPGVLCLAVARIRHACCASLWRMPKAPGWLFRWGEPTSCLLRR